MRIVDPLLDGEASYVPAANIISGEIKAIPSMAEVEKQERVFDFQDRSTGAFGDPMTKN